MFDVNKILASKNAKMNFLKGLIRIAKSDGKDSESERIYFKQSAMVMELSEEEADTLEEIWNQTTEIKIQFDCTEEKMFFLIQAIQLCWVDGGYDEKEKEEMKKIASEMGISKEALEKVEAWAYEGICWDKKGEELLLLK